MMKKLLLLCLLPVFVFAEEKNNCFKLENMEEINSCYQKLADKNTGNEEELEKLSGELSERDKFWQYTKIKDEMRNQFTYAAVVHSKNKLAVLDNTEEDVTLILGKRENIRAVVFSIKKGMFNCRYNGCSIAMKIDEGMVFNLTFDKDEFGTSLHLANKKQKIEFVKKLKKGKQMIVELPIYVHGNQQVKFNIEGLKWEHF